MASFVAKVQFQNSLRRLALGSDATALTFSQLVVRTRDLFQIPTDAKLSLTYVDRDGDVVTMVDDQDLQDALVMQSLNPLRLTVATVDGGSNVAAKSDSAVAPSGVPPVAIGPSLTAAKSSVDNVAATGGDQQEETFSKESVQEPQQENAGAAKEVSEKNDSAVPSEGAPAGATPGGEAAADEQQVHYGIVCDGCSMRYIRGTRYKSVKKPDYDLCQSCFEKPGVNRSEFAAFKRGRPPGVAIFVRGSGRNGRNGFGCAEGACPRMEKGTETGSESAAAAAKAEGGENTVFHYGVVCDGCNTTPLVGPRFKSTKKEDYDLCQSCMQKVEGSTSDEYTRVDQPVAQIHPSMFVGRGFRAFPPYAMFPFMPFGRPWCSRRACVPGVDPSQNGAAADRQHEVTKDKEQDRKDPAPTPESEKAQSDARIESEKARSGAPKEAQNGAEKLQSEAQPAAVTQDAVVAGTQEKKADVMESSQNPTELPVISDEASKTNAAVPQQAVAAEDISSFEGMVAKLAAMGFTDSKLNEELLRKNNLDLRLTLDDLCAAEEWDPMLEELQEMGFYDTDMNRRLLVQNNGNMKSVLKQLVRMAKMGSGK